MAAQACTPSLPWARATDQLWGSLERDRGPGWGWSEWQARGRLSLPPARQGLAVRGMELVGDSGAFWRFPACRWLWLISNSRPGSAPVGTEGLGTSGLWLSLQGPESVGRAPNPRCSDTPPADQGAGGEGTPSPGPSSWRSSAGSGRTPAPLAGTERSQCLPCVGTQWAVPSPERFHQHQFISLSPRAGQKPGAAERESHHCPN